MATYQCPDCGYTYDEIQGHQHEGFPPGTPWSQVPDDFSCPDCAVRDKQDFVLIGGAPSAETSTAQVIEPAPAPIPEPAAAALCAPAAPQPSQPAPATSAAGTGFASHAVISTTKPLATNMKVSRRGRCSVRSLMIGAALTVEPRKRTMSFTKKN